MTRRALRNVSFLVALGLLLFLCGILTRDVRRTEQLRLIRINVDATFNQALNASRERQGQGQAAGNHRQQAAAIQVVDGNKQTGKQEGSDEEQHDEGKEQEEEDVHQHQKNSNRPTMPLAQAPKQLSPLLTPGKYASQAYATLEQHTWSLHRLQQLPREELCAKRFIGVRLPNAAWGNSLDHVAMTTMLGLLTDRIVVLNHGMCIPPSLHP